MHLIFSAQEPDTKQWWVRIAYEGEPYVTNEESWVKAELLFSKPAVVTPSPLPPDGAATTTATDAAPSASVPVQEEPRGTLVAKGDQLLLHADTTYELRGGDDTLSVLRNFPGANVTLYGKGTKIARDRSALSVDGIYCAGGDVYDDPTLAPRGKVPAGEVYLIYSAQDPDTKQWWVRIAYEGGPHVTNEESWVKAELIFPKPIAAPAAPATAQPALTPGLDGKLAKSMGH